MSYLAVKNRLKQKNTCHQLNPNPKGFVGS